MGNYKGTKKLKPGSKDGRPTIYTKELGILICKRISGGESVRAICKDKDMPSQDAIYGWLLDERKKEFAENYERARNSQAEILFDELLEIADDGTNDYTEKEFNNGNIVEIANSEHIQRSRLRVDTRKWYLSKVLPKKFGDKLDMTTNGKDIPVPILGGVTKDKTNNS